MTRGLIWAFRRKGERILNPGNPRVYAPVLRSPLLFHNTGLYCPANNPVQPRVAQSNTNLYFTLPTSPLRSQSRYTVQPQLSDNSSSYPYYSTMPQVMIPSLVPLSSYSLPNVFYASTTSSKGLAIILIATLMLVALDLVIVRPQKSRSEIRNSMSGELVSFNYSVGSLPSPTE